MAESSVNQVQGLVRKIWNYAGILRDDGVSYGDYVEQITYLLFLKMAHERRALRHEVGPIPEGYDWRSLMSKDGDELEVHYRHILTFLGRWPGILGTIFRKAQNKIQDPAKLKRLISMMDEETWLELNTDVKGEIYEGLLERNAADVRSGAGQYFTPRPLIQAIVEVMRPEPGMRICDPACGTGGFLLAAHDYIQEHHDLDLQEKEFMRVEALRGYDIVDGVVRLCTMNLYLHGIGGEEDLVESRDSLRYPPWERFDIVLTNPPFGKKSSYTVVGADGRTGRDMQTYERDDFWVTTSNKQINFLQHVKSLLKIGGRAAVVVPDNVLFEGGAGETVRRKLLREFDVHTLLRLPTGVFYAQGVKANVLFFDSTVEDEQPLTKKLWVYDFRTDRRFTFRQNKVALGNLTDFIASYNPEDREKREETDRFRAFTYEELVQRDKANLDIFWTIANDLGESRNDQSSAAIAAEVVTSLRAALDQFSEVQEELEELD